LTSNKIRRLVAHLVLLVGVAISMFPFYWMVVMATNTTGDIFRFPPKLTIGSHLLTNIHHVFQQIDFFDSLAAFTFAKYNFPGKRVLFIVLLATFMVPGQLASIPQFVLMAHLGWVGALKALIIPSAANAFGIFWMRQYIEGAVHDDLLDAGRLDGCNFLRLYWHVGLPVIRPGLAFLGIFTFIGSWNDYLWPLVVLVNPQHQTLQVALSQLNSIYNTSDYSMVMAGALMAVLPLIVVFIIGARNFIADLAAGAVKS
jgi:cellobiose transport system permease protein